MSKQSNDLRDQARRASRLAFTISDFEAGKALRTLAAEYEAQADRLDAEELRKFED